MDLKIAALGLMVKINTATITTRKKREKKILPAKHELVKER